ncbi:esterase [Anaeromyces robustus]|uniref:Esterase n=1 Tax=Anaeromyces robustus TaxID=1754192 RepID=A0A1Y1W8G9_9FUNG|nr:esterase [Anaeromyces robustus]|eukprot:ORX69831.1 esterase [Anaeromyces robustus]
MDKLQITNTCPANFRYKQNNIQYPSPQKITYFSSNTNSERKMNIILPVGYDESKKYPIVYFLHGIFGDEDSMLDESTIAIPTNLLKEGKAKEFIMVLPSEYAPTPGNEVEPGFSQKYFDGYDNFINELVDVIMPYMEQNYPILTGKDNTALCGFSMGGRNSLYIAYKRSDLFGYVGDDFSGHHPGLFTEEQFRSDDPPYVTLISCGTNDSVVHEFPKSYHEILTRNNQKHIWFEVPGADHNEDAISAGLYNFVQTIFGALNN